MLTKTSNIIFIISLLAFTPAQATLRLPALVGSHMVLQRDRPVPVWGWAAPGEVVTLTFLGHTYAASAPDATGRWQATLPATPAGGPYTLTVRGRRTIELTDILLGDVWLASGQSNMQFAVKNSNNATQEIAAAHWPRIRFFTVAQTAAYHPQAEVAGTGWQVCSPATAAGFSAVAYFFSRDLYQQYQVPMGVVVSSWDGSPAEAWTSAEGLRALPEFGPAVATFARKTTTLPADQLAYEADQHSVLHRVRTYVNSYLAGSQPQPVPAPIFATRGSRAPTALYNGMIAPLMPLAIKGVIWYQGESNIDRAAQYRTLFPALIADWRRHWGTELPFLFVQLANMQPVKAEPDESDWAELREAQAQALRLPRTGMATAIDLGDPATIHPRNKQEVGRRLALAARRTAYGEAKLTASGPIYASFSVKGNAIELKFSSIETGMLVRGGAALRGFAVAGADRRFRWATARLVGNAVLVQSALVPAPVAVRYDWAGNPTGNLYNQAGLPAVPFRTDTWPGMTEGHK